MPYLSIIVPVFNAEKYLEKCIRSICNQSFKDWELLLINDGSTDQSDKICEVFTKKDERIHLYNKKNGGVASARNYGIAIAKGKYIAFVDSDDFVEEDMYFSMLTVAEKYNCDVVMCDCLKEYKSGNKLYTHNIRSGYYNKQQLKNEYFQHLLIMPNIEYPATISNWLFIFKSYLCKECGLQYEEGIRYSEDLLFGAQMMYLAKSFYYMKGQAFYHYNCMNLSSATHTFVADKWKDYQHLYKRTKEYFGNCTDYSFIEQIDKMFLFFLFNTINELITTKALEAEEKETKIREILNDLLVKEMFHRVKIIKLPISLKQKIVVIFCKYRIGIKLLCIRSKWRGQ